MSVLVLHDDHDRKVDATDITELMTGLPDAELVRLRNSGHMLPLTDTAVVGDHVTRWVRRCPPTVAAGDVPH